MAENRKSGGGQSMTDAEIRALYAANKDFREYVDKYRTKYQQGGGISLKEALTHLIVHEVAEQYKEVIK